MASISEQEGAQKSSDGNRSEQVRVAPGSSSIGELIIHAEDAGSVKGEIKLAGEKQAAFFLAKGVGLLIIIATLVVLFDWIIRTPGIAMPAGIVQLDPDKAKTVIDNFKNLNDLYLDRSVRIFDTIVARSLLPVFTAILGYIFGAKSESK